jgi:poly(3-hydroxybutyrate) depolymerase
VDPSNHIRSNAASGRPKRDTAFTVPLAPQGAPVAGEMRTRELRCGSAYRRFVLYVPAGQRDRPLPVVFNLHGSTSYPEEQMVISDMASMADRYGFCVLAPEGLGRQWNVPYSRSRSDDVRFIRDALEATARIDRLSSAITRICFGNGSRSVTMYRVAALGHQWPGSSVDIGPQFGPPSAALSATKRMFEYFRDADLWKEDAMRNALRRRQG